MPNQVKLELGSDSTRLEESQAYITGVGRDHKITVLEAP